MQGVTHPHIGKVHSSVADRQGVTHPHIGKVHSSVAERQGVTHPHHGHSRSLFKREIDFLLKCTLVKNQRVLFLSLKMASKGADLHLDLSAPCSLSGSQQGCRHFDGLRLLIEISVQKGRRSTARCSCTCPFGALERQKSDQK